jgi:methionine synthase II (cobalamin-independent)
MFNKIRSRPGERSLMSQGGLRVFCLTNGNLTRDDMVTRFAQAHDGLLAQAPEPGPWMLGIYARGRTELLKLYE